MRTILLLIYLGMALLPPTWREEAAKLPSLWQHYEEHRSMEPDSSFRHFWRQHYGEDYGSHRDAHDHSSLPGKAPHQHQHACCAQPLLLPPVLPVWDLNIPLQEPVHKAFAEPVWPAGRPVQDIWQPPKQAA